MKATGIVRRIDDLGRVVVPKEIRRTLRIREGDPLEIFTDREGEIILKKYSPIGELSAFAKQYAESLSQVLECLVGICDMDQVVAAAGNGKKEIQDEDITGELGEFLKERKTRNAKAGEKRYVPIVRVSEPYKQEVISPILCGFSAESGTYGQVQRYRALSCGIYGKGSGQTDGTIGRL